jgi:hypothetical protein
MITMKALDRIDLSISVFKTSDQVQGPRLPAGLRF